MKICLLKYVEYFEGEDHCWGHQDRGVQEDEPSVQGAAKIQSDNLQKLSSEANTVVAWKHKQTCLKLKHLAMSRFQC